MRLRNITFLLIFLCLASTQIFGQTARVQVIHNSADAAAATVDVWLNNTLLLDDFSFRTASPFVNAPAGTPFDITIQPSNSVDTTNGLWRQSYTLMGGSTYILVANGIISPSGYSPAPAFDIYVNAMGREAASMMGNTDVLVFHGSTDAPTVDVVEVGVGAGTVVDDAAYGDFAGYLELTTADYSLQVRDQSGTATVAQFDAPLATLGLQGGAAVVVASGFLDPSMNSNGPAFGLYAALPTGGPLVALPPAPISTARVQVIHNSADAAAATVDVWLNDGLLIDDFNFRTASPFIDAPAGSAFDITIQPANSVDTTNGLWRQSYTLTGGETYVLVANGIISPMGYSPVQPFDIYVNAMGREAASMSMNTDVLVFHGSTDAPTVDVVEVGAGAGTIVDNAAYGDFAGYLELPTADYSLQIRDESGTVTVAQFDAPLSTLSLNGAAAVVVASGFLNPTQNSNGSAFGLWVALPSGGALVELPAAPISTSRVQVVHNSADAGAATVDIWLDNTLLLDDFEFRTASPFIDAPAGTDIEIRIAAPTSTDTTNPIALYTYNLTGGQKYIIAATGIVSPSGYTPATPFNLEVFAGAKEIAKTAGEVDVLVFHGSTDAPTVDIYEATAGELVDDLEYAEYAGYLELPAADYTLEVRDASGMSIVASYAAPLATLALQNQAITVYASGFLDPSVNSNGAGFGLWASLPSGGPLVELPLATAIAEPNSGVNAIKAYPNPAVDALAIEVDLATSSKVTVQVRDLMGAELINQDLGQMNAGNNRIDLDLNTLPVGTYLYQVTTDKGIASGKFVKLN